MSVALQPSRCILINVSPRDEQNEFLPLFESVSQKIRIPFLRYDCLEFSAENIGKCLSANLTESDAGTARTVLLLTGFPLEEAITLFALTTLSIGYDVYVLVDYVQSKRSDFEIVFYSRLVQAGVILATLPQVLFEFQMCTEGSSFQSELLELRK